MRFLITARNLRGKTGVSAIVLEQVSRLVKLGHSVDVAGEKLDVDIISATGATPVKFHRLPSSRYMARRYFSWHVSRLIKKNNYDLIIGNSEILQQDVLFVHNLSELELEHLPDSGHIGSGLVSKIRFDRNLFQKQEFRACIANSHLMRDDLIERYNIEPEKIHVVHPGYDPNHFSREDRSETRRKYRADICPPDKLLVGFYTSGHYAKRGADIMLNALNLMDPELRERVRILALGSERNTITLERQFAEAQLGHLLYTRDKTSDIGRYYHATDLLFYPARMEEFGLVVLEAVACGTPALTSRAVGSTELFPNIDMPMHSDAEIFTRELNELVANPGKLATLADKQHEAAKGHTWDRYFDETMQIYGALA